MAQPMIECPECSKKHRAAGFEERVAKCKATREKREAKEAAKQAEIDRRRDNARQLPIKTFIRQGMVEGWPWEGANSILAAMKKDYPPPFGGAMGGRPWDITTMLYLDSIELEESWGMRALDIAELRAEKFVLGSWVSKYPPLERVNALSTHQIHLLDDPEEPAGDGEMVVVGGVVSQPKRKTTKRGDAYGRFRLEGDAGGVDVICFPPMYDRVKNLIALDRIVMVAGRVDRTFSFQINAEDVCRPEDIEDKAVA